MKIIFKIKELRLERGLTLEDLSKLTGISSTHINDIENQYKKPSLEIIILLAKALHVDIKDLYSIKW